MLASQIVRLGLHGSCEAVILTYGYAILATWSGPLSLVSWGGGGAHTSAPPGSPLGLVQISGWQLRRRPIFSLLSYRRCTHLPPFCVSLSNSEAPAFLSAPCHIPALGLTWGPMKHYTAKARKADILGKVTKNS